MSGVLNDAKVFKRIIIRRKRGDGGSGEPTAPENGTLENRAVARWGNVGGLPNGPPKLGRGPGRVEQRDMRRNVTDRNKENAKQLRRLRTKPEAKLRHALSASRKFGCPFRFQHCIGAYIVDFACVRARIVVEIDGWSHMDREAQDGGRQAWLETQGWAVLRYSNEDALFHADAVAEEVVRRALNALGKAHPTPS